MIFENRCTGTTHNSHVTPLHVHVAAHRCRVRTSLSLISLAWLITLRKSAPCAGYAAPQPLECCFRTMHFSEWLRMHSMSGGTAIETPVKASRLLGQTKHKVILWMCSACFCVCKTLGCSGRSSPVVTRAISSAARVILCSPSRH